MSRGDDVQASLEQLIAEDELAGRGSENDRVFFEQNPKRQYRGRLATANEVAALELLGCAASSSDGRFLWMLIKQIAPGVRLRMSTYMVLPLLQVELSEDETREIYARAVSP